MKTLRMVLILMAAVAFGAGLVHAEGKLFIYNWTDYTSPDLLKKFEKETNIKVTLDTFDSNETLLAKLKAGGGSGYDIVVPSHNYVPVMINEGLLMEINAGKLKDSENIIDALKSPPGIREMYIPFPGSTVPPHSPWIQLYTPETSIPTKYFLNRHRSCRAKLPCSTRLVR